MYVHTDKESDCSKCKKRITNEFDANIVISIREKKEDCSIKLLCYECFREDKNANE